MGLYRRRTYTFKAKNCDELENMDISFAIKEYLQNSVGQVLKALQVRVWRDWNRNGPFANTAENLQARVRCKEALLRDEPQIFVGDQGLFLRQTPWAQPLFVLKTHIPPEQIRCGRRRHELRVVVVLWRLPSATGLTVFNNYLDENATFDHFVYDGASTSKDNHWAVGQKGKGFILATSYLAQQCEENRSLSDEAKYIGVGFNVGSRLCRAHYDAKDPCILLVKREDLRPLTLEAFRKESKSNTHDPVEITPASLTWIRFHHQILTVEQAIVKT